MTQTDTPAEVARPRGRVHLILGAPRSGTSAIAQMLSDAGVWFGDPAHFLDTQVHRHNPNFFELQWCNEVNDLIIQAMGSRYGEDFLPLEEDFRSPVLDALRDRVRTEAINEFGDHPDIGLKDPRFAFTLPLWRDVFHELDRDLTVMLTMRSEAAVRRSNAILEPKWNDDQSWNRFYLQTLLAAWYFSRDIAPIVMDYDALMADPAGYATANLDRWNLPTAELRAMVGRLEPSLVHQRPDGASIADPLVERADRGIRDGSLDPNLYLEVRRIARLYLNDPRNPTFARLKERVGGAEREIAALTTYRDGLELHAKQLAAESAARKEALDHHLGLLQTADATIENLRNQVKRTTERFQATEAELQAQLRQERAALDERTRQLAGARSRMDSGELRYCGPESRLNRLRPGGRRAMRLTEVQLAPLAGIEPRGPGRWTVPGTARFLLSCLPVSGEVRVRLKLHVNATAEVRLYFDTGGLFNDERCFALGAVPPDGELDRVVTLPEPVYCFRLDIATSADELTIERFEMCRPRRSGS